MNQIRGLNCFAFFLHAIFFTFKYKMTETAASTTNPSEKIANLMKEAESLKVKLEEERQKLNDVVCK